MLFDFPRHLCFTPICCSSSDLVPSGMVAPSDGTSPAPSQPAGLTGDPWLSESLVSETTLLNMDSRQTHIISGGVPHGPNIQQLLSQCKGSRSSGMIHVSEVPPIPCDIPPEAHRKGRDAPVRVEHLPPSHAHQVQGRFTAVPYALLTDPSLEGRPASEGPLDMSLGGAGSYCSGSSSPAHSASSCGVPSPVQPVDPGAWSLPRTVQKSLPRPIAPARPSSTSSTASTGASTGTADAEPPKKKSNRGRKPGQRKYQKHAPI